MKPDSHRRRNDRRRSDSIPSRKGERGLNTPVISTTGKPERLHHTHDWKTTLTDTGEGYYTLSNQDTNHIPVRLFMTEQLVTDLEDNIYSQIINATRFPGVKLVCLTPDAHYGYGVAVGSVILTDAETGAIAMGPVGYDIGCFSGDTLIPTLAGESLSLKSLSESREPIWVYSISEEEKIVVAQATAKQTRVNAKLLRITLDNGATVDCTPDHLFLLRSGTYEAASQLQVGRSLMPFNSRYDRDGYLTVRSPGSNNDQRIHWVMARQGILGEIPSFSPQRTIIHHEDFGKANNLPKNLKFMGDVDHMHYHWKNGRHNTAMRPANFEELRVAGLQRLAATPEGHAFMAARGTRNIKKYMEENPKHFRASVKGNGVRGTPFLVGYNQSEKGRAKSSEIGRREFKCELCQETVIGGLGLHNHRYQEHGYNHKIVKIEALPGLHDAFCLTVPEFHNFALAAGVFVHNCGMISARSNVPANKANRAKRLEFNREVMKRIATGAGNSSDLPSITDRDFQHLIREGAAYYSEHFGHRIDHSRAERQMLPVDDSWDFPRGGKGNPERGITQLGSIGGGNHFCELQRCIETGTLFVQLHTGSRGFGHGLATNYFDLAKTENPSITALDLGYFTPESKHYKDYLNAVAAGANFAMVNRLRIFEQVAIAFRRVFGEDLELLYEISHNLVQREWHPDYGMVNVHRKGATRALPGGHPQLEGTLWEKDGHPILIPGSNMDFSYILRPVDSAKSGYSVNHGAGRRLSRSAAKNNFTQSDMDKRYKDMDIVVNLDGRVPLDEAGPAYKSSQEVIAAVTGANLARVEYTLWPLSSIKSI